MSRFTRNLCVLAISVLAVIGLSGCSGGDASDTDYCAYEAGLFESCDIDRVNQAPKLATCAEFLAACESGSVCAWVESRAICTKTCSEYGIGCPNGSLCSGYGYCYPE